MTPNQELIEAGGEIDQGLWLEVAEDEPSETVARLLDYACHLQVSDLFLLSEERYVSVTARHLGITRRVSQLSPEFGRRCISHVKGLAGMDIAERRRPLDGRWIYERSAGRVVDLRISTLPTLYGEDLAVRLLDRENRLLGLEGLGLTRREYNVLVKLLGSPSGLILVTGPTGSGKTTTLYACLAHLNNGKRKINTIEDPVEYSLPGMRQSQVNLPAGVGFAELLRSALRQAPDVIMVGEVRDPETADIAVRAANSGHLVLATLHAPITAAAVQSMLSFDVSPYHLASSLLGVISQRLLRTLSAETKVPYDVSLVPNLFDEVKPWLEPGQGQMIYGPGRDPASRTFGYAGRTGVFEVMTVSEALRQLTAQKQPAHVIRQKAMDEGMVGIRQAALLAIARGQTSVEEVFRTIPSEYLA